MSTAASSRAGRRAGLAAATFAAAGVLSAIGGVPDWTVSAPLGLSYALLVANTYCSVRCFSSIIPGSLREQRALDGALLVTYLALATSIADTVRFAACAALLFATATLKYALLLGKLEPGGLLARKVRVDTLGTMASVVALVAALGGHPLAAAWALLALQVVANVYLLWWKPIYRLPAPRPGPDPARPVLVDARVWPLV